MLKDMLHLRKGEHYFSREGWQKLIRFVESAYNPIKLSTKKGVGSADSFFTLDLNIHLADDACTALAQAVLVSF